VIVTAQYLVSGHGGWSARRPWLTGTESSCLCRRYYFILMRVWQALVTGAPRWQHMAFKSERTPLSGRATCPQLPHCQATSCFTVLSSSNVLGPNFHTYASPGLRPPGRPHPQRIQFEKELKPILFHAVNPPRDFLSQSASTKYCAPGQNVVPSQWAVHKSLG
jgi:hypothetical protein